MSRTLPIFLRVGKAALVSLFLVVAICYPSFASAATVKLAWDPVTSSSVSGYKFYYSLVSGPPYNGTFANEGPSPIDIPVASLDDVNEPGVTVSGIPSCGRVYFAVTAYNDAGESGYSNEIDAVIGNKPTGVTVQPDPAAGVVVISWDALEQGDTGSITSHRVHYDMVSRTAPDPYLGTGADQGVSPISTSGTSTALLLSGLPVQTEIFAVVEAICDINTSRSSDEASGFVGTGQPSTDAGTAQVPDAGFGGRVVVRGTQSGGCVCTPLHETPLALSFLLVILGLRRLF